MNELKLARAYLSKAQSSKARGIEFNLSFTSYKNLYRAKRCFYTGIQFDEQHKKSIDRIDNSKGYIKGNVVACWDQVNHLKSFTENGSGLSMQHVKKMVNALEGLNN